MSKKHINHFNNTRNVLFSIIGLVAISILIILICFFKPNDTLLFSDYIQIQFNGDNNYGTIVADFNLDSLIKDCKLKEKEIQAIKQITGNDSFLQFTCEEDGKLTNGDSITIKVLETEANMELEKILNVDFQYENIVETVRNLNEENVIDLFSYLVIDTQGTMSGSGNIVFKVKNDTMGIDFVLKHTGENGKLKNGDMVTLSIPDEEKDTFYKKTGKAIKTMSQDYLITELEEELNRTSRAMQMLGVETRKSLDKVAENWVVSGLNDALANQLEKRQFKLIGYAVYKRENEKNDVFSAIYRIIDNFALDEPYYVTFSISGKLTTRGYELLLNGEPMPQDYVYYEKEYVRNEEFGIEPQYEKMCFNENGTYFAGHKTLENAIKYLNDKYAADGTEPMYDNSLNAWIQTDFGKKFKE